jgi:hypothetical protein
MDDSSHDISLIMEKDCSEQKEGKDRTERKERKEKKEKSSRRNRRRRRQQRREHKTEHSQKDEEDIDEIIAKADEDFKKDLHAKVRLQLRTMRDRRTPKYVQRMEQAKVDVRNAFLQGQIKLQDEEQLEKEVAERFRDLKEMEHRATLRRRKGKEIETSMSDGQMRTSPDDLKERLKGMTEEEYEVFKQSNRIVDVQGMDIDLDEWRRSAMDKKDALEKEIEESSTVSN